MYQKVAIVSKIRGESFFSSFKVLAEEGYLKAAGTPQGKRQTREDGEQNLDTALFEAIKMLKKRDGSPCEVIRDQGGGNLSAEAL